MKFYTATTKAPLELTGITCEGAHVFPIGTTVSATEATRAGRWHLNAHLAGEVFDGYADTESLTIGAVIATCNEGK